MAKKIDKKKILFFFLILISSYWLLDVQVNTLVDNYFKEDSLEEATQIKEEKGKNDEEKKSFESIVEKTKNLTISYKNENNLLKKEIQKRKKLQKNLLETYNNTFDKNTLTQIISNGTILEWLKNKYLSLQTDKNIII